MPFDPAGLHNYIKGTEENIDQFQQDHSKEDVVKEALDSQVNTESEKDESSPESQEAQAQALEVIGDLFKQISNVSENKEFSPIFLQRQTVDGQIQKGIKPLAMKFVLELLGVDSELAKIDSQEKVEIKDHTDRIVSEVAYSLKTNYRGHESSDDDGGKIEVRLMVREKLDERTGLPRARELSLFKDDYQDEEESSGNDMIKQELKERTAF